MAYLSPARESWTYTDDAGFVWRVAAVTSIATQAKQGGAHASSSIPPKPADITMRRATVRSAGGVSRTVPLYDATQSLVVGGTLGVISLNLEGTETVFTAIGSVIPEKRPRVSVTSK